MTDIEKKLHHLQNCLGEKKLKQIGLIPCSTCQEIMTNALNLNLSPDLKNKPYLTPEEISTINEAILGSINSSSQETQTDSSNSFESTSPDESTNKSSLELDETNTLDDINLSNNLNDADIATTLNNTPAETDSEAEDSSTSASITSGDGSNFEISPELVASLNTTPTQTEQELVTKLLAILSQSHHPIQADLGMGYTYSPPMIQYPHSLACSECGRLYTITHPDLKLIPLPVYLSDTEYEMIKGVYVDILL